MIRLLAGVAAAGGVSALAYRFRSLSASGAVAATVVGALAVYAGWPWGVLLFAFFLSAALLSRYRESEKTRRTGDRIAKGGPRDAAQVLANGCIFAVAALMAVVQGWSGWSVVGAASLAAAAADTWATEVGSLAPAPPRLILSWRRVPAGTSGAVSPLGTMAALAGSLFIGSAATILGLAPTLAVVAGGLVGSLADSLLGASLQTRFTCPNCEQPTERRIHACGTRTHHTGGLRWLDNDAVNLAATLAGAVTSLLWIGL